MVEPSTPCLKVVHDAGDETVYPLEGKPLTLGRRSDNEVKINDRHVSRYHARLCPEGGAWVLRDLDSKLGTYINGQRVMEATLKDGDVITLGQPSTIRIYFLESAAAAVPLDTFVGHERLRRMVELPSDDEPQEDSRDLMLLLEVTKALNSSLVLSDVLNMVMDAVVRVTGAERGFLMLADAHGELRFRIARNFRQESLEGSGFQISRSVVENVFHSGKPEILVNVQDDPRFRNQESILALDLKTVMCVPLIVHVAKQSQSKVVGVLYVDNKALSQGFSKKGLKLLESLASHAVIAIENARLHEEALEMRRIEEELRLAHTIQERLLPKESPLFSWAQVDGWSHPSRAVGGDYYAYHTFPDGRFGFVIADVTGKGVPAALLMALLDGIFSALFELDLSVSQTVSRVNNYLYAKSGEKFVTLFYGILAPDGQLTYTNAGHNPPFLCSSRGETQQLQEGGLLLGAFPDLPFAEGGVTIKKGDTLVLFTDGLPEARDQAGIEFGEDRLLEIVRKNLDQDVATIRESLHEAVTDFAEGVAQYDDMTLLVLKYCATSL